MTRPKPKPDPARRPADLAADRARALGREHGAALGPVTPEAAGRAATALAQIKPADTARRRPTAAPADTA